MTEPQEPEGREEPDRPTRLLAPEEAREVLAARQERGETIVFTNGCFDLIHPGHVIYLEQARALGDFLVVGLNSDRSVRALKGPGRPILAEVPRAWILSALRAVDMVVLFDEETPLELISQVRPNILCKGGDYRPEEVVGKGVVEEDGGRVEILAFHPGFSTTDLISEIRRPVGGEG